MKEVEEEILRLEEEAEHTMNEEQLILLKEYGLLLEARMIYRELDKIENKEGLLYEQIT